jgi:hypothetical protein
MEVASNIRHGLRLDGNHDRIESAVRRQSASAFGNTRTRHRRAWSGSTTVNSDRVPAESQPRKMA